MDRILLEGSICPVCGLDQEQDFPYLMGSICDCCGTQCAGLEFSLEIGRRDRQQWIDAGYPWFSPDDRSANWDPIVQLNQIPEKYR